MMKTGFDNEMYLKRQSEKIAERIAKSGEKLYLEFGGKLFDDHHAARVLPGFEPDSKIRMLAKLKDKAEVIIVINANDIEKNKMRADIGITYDVDVLRLIDAFRGYGLLISSVVLTHFKNQPSAVQYIKKLEDLELKVYKHYTIKDYPNNIPFIVSDEGFGKNDFVETTRPLVVVTAPGPGSGKMATCLSQLYHEYKRGVKAGYAKFETFPVWNLDLNHPVNLAYEAATVDLGDENQIDFYHERAYGERYVNYNRDIAIYPLVESMLTSILGTCPYKSPTDMGVNMVGFCINDDEAVRKASNNEIIRRYYKTLCAIRQSNADKPQAKKMELIMEKANITTSDRPCIQAAIDKAAESNAPAAAAELPDGRIVTGKTSNLLGASSALLLNILKELANIPDPVDLISSTVIEPIQKLKVGYLGNHNPRLHMDELLVALSICALTDANAKKAMNQLENLKNIEVHSSVILSQVDINVFRKLGVNLTCEPDYQTKKLYHGK
ncbi:MAG: DUF1846 domain-containing protein [Lachnospiraceae bacterium]|nr:DUF1846 domain-containing protein [Lachnospiraceae bacterium]